MNPESVDRLIWVVWIATWLAAAAWSDATTKRPSTAGRERVYRLLLAVGAVMLFGLYPHRGYKEPVLWRTPAPLAWTMVALATAGFAFAWWARVFLGRLWSGTVSRKADHYVVDTGPYALVRHPIYSGVILAAFATAVLRATAVACAGAALMALGCYIKARLEEDFLSEQLGADRYAAYARRVPMLVPFLLVCFFSASWFGR